MKKNGKARGDCSLIAMHQFLRIMKLSFVLLFMSFLSLSANVVGQNDMITYSGSAVKVSEVLEYIEQNTDYTIAYSSEYIDLDRAVTVAVKNEKVGFLLNEVFNGTSVAVRVTDKRIMLYDKEVQQQDETSKNISGIITDDKGMVIPGASILIKGTSIGTITDMDGKFTLSNVPDDAVLEISFIGMKSQDIAVAGKTVFNVSLTSDVIGLDEVVAVGYGTQKKVTVTGSVASADGELISRVPTSSVTNTMVGNLPGLVANNTSGEPGYDDAELLIRGRSTTGDNSPLIVVDGVADRAGGFSRIDPNDIESISILKDASAAIYGSRAANGVILVTTKRGKKGKVSLNYSMNYGLRKPTVLPEMAESYQYAELINEIETGIYGRDPMYSDAQIELFRNGEDPDNYPNVKVMDQVLKNWSTQTQHSISASGGSEKIQFYTSLGYQYNDNYYKNSDSYYKQYNLRSNIDYFVTDNLKISFNLAARQEDRISGHYGSESIWRYLVKHDPRANIIWPGTDLPVVAAQDDFNPITATDGSMGYQDNKTSYLNADLRFDWDLSFVTDGLSVAGGLYVDRSDNFYKHFQKAFYLYEKVDAEYLPVKFGPSNAYLNENMNQTLGITSNIRLNYEKSLGNNNIKAFVAYEQYESRYDYLQGSRQDYIASNVDELFAGDQTTANNSGTASEYGRQNYFGRVDYNYLEKYLFQFNWRYDGSENFPKGKRFGFFPGVSAGWRISEEEFWKSNLSAIDYFKLRGSWGQMGNDKIDRFQYMTTYTYDNPAILGGASPEPVTGVWQNSIANPNVTWEVATTSNIGFDSRFLNMFTFNFELFKTTRKDILAQRNAAVPQYAGITLPDENIGEAEAKGFEAVLGFSKKLGDFKINTTFNYSFAKSEITYMDEPEGVLPWQAITGKSIGADWYMYDAIGIFRSEQDLNNYPHLTNAEVGDLMFRDVDENGVIDGDDYIRPDKTSSPEIVYGFNLNVDYKQWSLSALFQGASNVWQYIFWESGTIGNFTKDFYNNHWTSDNVNAKYPRVYDRQATVTGQNNTFWLENASYLRLKNIQIAYTLPKQVISKLPIDNLRLYVSGYNLLTFCGLKNTDPETTQGSQGFAAWSTPQAKVINFGLNLSF